jgi:hypothetical protein
LDTPGQAFAKGGIKAGIQCERRHIRFGKLETEQRAYARAICGRPLEEGSWAKGNTGGAARARTILARHAPTMRSLTCSKPKRGKRAERSMGSSTDGFRLCPDIWCPVCASTISDQLHDFLNAFAQIETHLPRSAKSLARLFLEQRARTLGRDEGSHEDCQLQHQQHQAAAAQPAGMAE